MHEPQLKGCFMLRNRSGCRDFRPQEIAEITKISTTSRERRNIKRSQNCPPFFSFSLSLIPDKICMLSRQSLSRSRFSMRFSNALHGSLYRVIARTFIFYEDFSVLLCHRPRCANWLSSWFDRLSSPFWRCILSFSILWATSIIKSPMHKPE